MFLVAIPRLVRDLAGKLGKQVELTLVGSSTELDKKPDRTHYRPADPPVRNSLDHGIELPEKRLAAGKKQRRKFNSVCRTSGRQHLH